MDLALETRTPASADTTPSTPTAPAAIASTSAGGPRHSAGPRRITMALALAVCLVGELMDALDGLITTVAGPSIVASVGGDGAFIQWLAAGYTIAMAAGLLVGGRLGDMFGRRRVFLLGMLGFTAASVLAACATGPGTLIGARVVQGLLGAMMVPQTFGMYRDIFPAHLLSKAFALMGPVMAISGIAGPVVAGLLLKLDLFGLGWRSLFLVNIPFCVAALLIGSRVLPANRRDRGLTLDWGSAVLAAVGLPAIMFGLVEGRDLGWPAWVLGLMAAGLALLVLFVRRQRTREQAGRTPLLEPSLFHNRTFLGGLVFGLAVFGGGMSVGFLLALFAQLGLGLSPLQASLLTLPDMLGMIAGMALMGRLGSNRRTMMIGTVVMVAGALGMLLILVLGLPAQSAWWLVPAVTITGVGSGLVTGPYFDLVITGVSDRETGSASGALSASQQISTAFGVAVFGSVFFALAAAAGDSPAGYARGFEAALLGIVLVTLCAIPSLRLLPRRAAAEE